MQFNRKAERQLARFRLLGLFAGFFAKSEVILQDIMKTLGYFGDAVSMKPETVMYSDDMTDQAFILGAVFNQRSIAFILHCVYAHGSTPMDRRNSLASLIWYGFAFLPRMRTMKTDVVIILGETDGGSGSFLDDASDVPERQ